MPVIDFNATMCKHCYKCVRNCDVKAIMVRDGRAIIMPNRCVVCGQCVRCCPQSAKVSSSELELVKSFMADGHRVIVSLSSSFMSLFPSVRPGQMKGALLELGFSAVRDVSEGAALVTEEYIKLLREGKMENIITSLCPSINDLIEIYYPQLIPYVAQVDPPSIAHAKLIKAEDPDARVVFIGPCVAEKREYKRRRNKGLIDAVLTFEDLNQWFSQAHISPETCEDVPFGAEDENVNRLYSVVGGSLSSIMATSSEEDHYRKLAICEVKDCIVALKSMAAGEAKGSFIEMTACSGGCVNGPAADSQVSHFTAKLDMRARVAREPADVSRVRERFPELDIHREFEDHSIEEKIPTEEQIREILRKTGKFTKEQELNCGACGYPTCRDKAVAIFQKKAELSMCIPFMQSRAESLANLVMETSPNIILMVDEDMRIRECSAAAEKYFGLTRQELLGHSLGDYMDTIDFKNVFASHENVHSRKVTYPNLGLTAIQNLVYIEKSGLILATLVDVTREEEQAAKDYEKRLETIDLAQKVIYKQMMVAQEIAGLLGETTAETKTTLTKLCDSLLDRGTESEVR